MGVTPQFRAMRGTSRRYYGMARHPASRIFGGRVNPLNQRNFKIGPSVQGLDQINVGDVVALEVTRAVAVNIKPE